MKKISVIFILIFCMLFAFQLNISANSEFKVVGAQVRSTGNAGIRFVCDIGSLDKSNVKQYGLLLAYGEVENIEELIIDSTINNKEVINVTFDSILTSTYFVTLFDIPSSQYRAKISARAYIISLDNEIVYSDTIVTRSLRDVAIQAYNDNDRSDFVLNIYNQFCISLINLTLDFTLNTYQESNEIYSLTYSNPNYFKVRIVITLNEGYFFNDTVKINCNNKYQSKDSEISIEDNVLTFYFNDPYWTGIY